MSRSYDVYTCEKCGNDSFVDDYGTHHLANDGHIDYAMDGDHEAVVKE